MIAATVGLHGIMSRIILIVQHYNSIRFLRPSASTQFEYTDVILSIIGYLHHIDTTGPNDKPVDFESSPTRSVFITVEVVSAIWRRRKLWPDQGL